MILGLIILLAVIWGAALNHNENEKLTAIEDAASRAQGLATFFARDASTSFHYADDYAKSLRRIFQTNGSLDDVRGYINDVPPNKTILSHITVMDNNGIPVLITDGRKERKSKPGVHARDRGYFKYQKNNKHDTAFFSLAKKGRNTGLVTVRLVRRN